MESYLRNNKINSALSNELLKVTQAAVISAVRYEGMGDKELVDQSAVDAMRSTLTNINTVSYTHLTLPTSDLV